jgi:hypothetical protein
MAGFEVTHKVVRYIPLETTDAPDGVTMGEALDMLLMRAAGMSPLEKDKSPYDNLPVGSVTIQLDDINLREMYFPNGEPRFTEVYKGKPTKR